jgi:hypothetical protein
MPWGRRPKHTFNGICTGLCAPSSLFFFDNNFLHPLFFSSEAKNLYRYHIVRWYNVSNITNIYTYTDVSLIKPSPGPLIAETREIDESPRMKSVSTLMSLHVHEIRRAYRKSIEGSSKVSTHVPRRVHSVATHMSLHEEYVYHRI